MAYSLAGRCLTGALLLPIVLCSCEDRSAPQPVTEMQATIAARTEAEPEVVEDTVEAQDEDCPHVALAPELPLVVRAGPNASTAQAGELSNGAVVRVSETRNDWAHLTSPIEGWVQESNVYDACESPAAVPAVPMGEKTYLLVTRWGEAQSRAGVELAGPAMESAMGFRRRDARPLSPPTPVTLVTRTGACVGEATHRVVLIGHCPGDRTEPLAATALEIDSCSELTTGDDLPHMAAPLMVGVFGRFPGATLDDWTPGESPTSEGQRANIARYLESDEEVPEAMRSFGESDWGWVSFEDRLWLLRGDDVLDILDESSSEPMQVRVGPDLLVALGSSGPHGHGFYMFPDATVPEQARELGYPQFSCGSN